MKKYSILFLILMETFGMFSQASQNSQIKSDLPTILPPSPTVAALMKFEEIPVSNYTGVPDISIPLFSTPTHSKDINLDISLKYHPAGIAADERASDVGLGWSLFAGGTVSRTVRGMPDEIFRMGSNGNVGIYRNSTPNFSNNYYSVADKLYNDNETVAEYEADDEYLWNAHIRGLFDTEHDLWQFNFMGNVGRFYIKKNSTNGQLEIVGLDDSRFKITNIYNGSDYSPQSFIIYDEKGYKYIFDVIEMTSSNSTVFSTSSVSGNLGSSMSPLIKFNSAFHLSKIYDNQNNVIVDFAYNDTVIKENVIDGSQTYNQQDYFGTTAYTINYFYYHGNPCNEYVINFNPLPTESSTTNMRHILAKKILKINVNGIAKIDFNYLKGREDTNIHIPDSSYVFKGIVIKDWNGNNIERYSLEQGYSTVKAKRMILKKVLHRNLINNTEYAQELFYETNDVGDNLVNKDYWGYFNLKSINYLGGTGREVTPNFCTSDVLQKITLPTGGSTIFDFESNTYSHVGDISLTNFDENLDNWDDKEMEYNFSLSIQEVQQDLLFSATVDQRVTFYPSITSDDLEYKGFALLKNGQPIPAPLSCPNEVPNCGLDFILQAGVNYRVKFWNVDINRQNEGANLRVVYHNRKKTTKQLLYGGGIRIKRIGYFDTDVDEKYYKNSVYYSQLILPNKEKKYNYDFFDTSFRSSGSLVFSVPKFEYKKNKRECTWCNAGNNMFLTSDDQTTFFYNVYTSFNNLQTLRTQGSDVGYKNVTVYETNNGRSEYEYTSPIDFPEEVGVYNLSPPFMPTENFDYKRGLLKKEKLFDNSNRNLSESLFDYSFVNYSQTTGFRVFYKVSDFVQGINPYIYFNDYKNHYMDCLQNRNPLTCFCYSGPVRDFIGFKFINEAFGWAKLTNKTTLNYFYPSGGTIPSIVQTDEAFTYNSLNKKIASQTTTNSLGDTLKTDYFYHTGNSPFSQNRISEIEKVDTYRNTDLLSSSKINYSTTWTGNQSYLPQSIQVSKGLNVLETKLKYNSYDEFSNPLEVQQENGVNTCYIWGYNKTQPIAKIENIAYAAIPANLITDVQTASDSGTEASLITALNNLRTDASLATTMVTTYTYKPLVGVSTITDPKGDKITYSYDAFGRLQNVKDKDNNILSENEYHYKN
jgi:YD repeat-containing protein